eukprot:scaffold6829_cov171-Amphora_coffeaeformis.AAC.17
MLRKHTLLCVWMTITITTTKMRCGLGFQITDSRMTPNKRVSHHVGPRHRSWPQRRRRGLCTTTTTALPAVPVAALLSTTLVTLSEVGRAASSLALAATWGSLAKSSILVTLASAALMSNAGWAPLTSPLYDACWKYFLPGSLVLLLLSLRSDDSSSSSSVDHSTSSSAYTASTIRQMGFPFVLASVASLVGCLVSLGLSLQFNILSPQQSLGALACLLASFIGGSVNFMATSRLVLPDATSASLISAMAAADLLVMAVYFGVLGVAVKSKRLKTFVTGKSAAKDPLTTTHALSMNDDGPSTTSVTHKLSKLQWVKGSVVAIAFTFSIVELAQRLESALSRFVPGTACGVLAIVTPTLKKYVPSHAIKVTPFWSEISFLTLFASIGLTANVGSALRAGPGCLVLSLVALIVHVLVLLGCTTIWNRTVNNNTIDLDTILIASNAAIGGPATAAAWAGRTAPRWALAATVWGVVGYATGTTVGVWFYQIMMAGR